MKQIEGFDNYWIEEDGTIWSDRQCTISKRKYKLKPRINTKGYWFVCLQNSDKKTCQRQVHRLVAQAYIPNPNNYPYVCHKDDNKRNPHKDNLFWGTHQMNMQDMWDKKRRKLTNSLENDV